MNSSLLSQREARPPTGLRSNLSFALLSLLPAAACASSQDPLQVNGMESTSFTDNPLRAGMPGFSASDPSGNAPPPPLSSPDPDAAAAAASRESAGGSLLSEAWSGVENSWLNVVRVVNDPEELKRFAGKQALRYLRRLARSQEGDGYQVEPQLTFRVGAGDAEPRSWETDQLLHPATYRGEGSRAYPDGVMPIRVGIGTDEIFNQNRNLGFRLDISSVDFDWQHFQIDRMTFKPALRWNNFTVAAEISTDENFGFAIQHQITW